MDNNQPSQARKQSALNERLYFLGTSDDGTYAIQGSTGEKVYNVTVTSRPKCTCPDFIYRRNRCKHIYFMLMRMLRVPDNLVDDAILPESFVAAWKLDFASRRLAQQLHQQHTHANVVVISSSSSSSDDDEESRSSSSSSSDSENSVISSGIVHSGGGGGSGSGSVCRKPLEGECPICLEALLEDQVLTFCATQCGNNIHLDCMQQYARHANRWQCPLCRADWWGDSDNV